MLGVAHVAAAAVGLAVLSPTAPNWRSAHAPDPAAVQAQTPLLQDDQVDPVEDVVVLGNRLDKAVAAFVEDVSAPVVGRGLARWNGRVCVGAVNLRGEPAQYLVDKVSDVILELGLEPGAPGCKPSILIIGASDGAAMADAIVKSRPSIFRPGGSGMSQSRRALREFRTSTAAVRWWAVSVPTDSQTGMPAVRIPGRGPAVISVDSVSRMRGRIRDDLRRVFVIVDVDQATDRTFDQLGAYVAMVTLAQVDPAADTADYPTILNLFDQAMPPPGLTDWDRAYLQAIYTGENRRILAFQQAEEMTATLQRAAPTATAQASGD